MSKKPLDIAMEDIEKNRAFAKTFLDKQAIIVRSVDKKIEALEKQLKRLEEEKQRELTKMEEYMELGVVLTHTLPDGFTVTYDHKRKMEIRNVGEFLRWLKAHCKTSEVLTFFDGAIKATAIKKFVEKKCDEQRAEGILEPKVDGVDIKEITFRRLTTFYKEKA
jgi:hypothetical protein